MKRQRRTHRLDTANVFTLVGIFLVATLIAGLVYGVSGPTPKAAAQDLQSTPPAQQHQATLKDYLPPNFRGRLYILQQKNPTTSQNQNPFAEHDDHDGDNDSGESGH